MGANATIVGDCLTTAGARPADPLAVVSDQGMTIERPIGTWCSNTRQMFGLSRLTPKPKRVLFIHTGGLPGLLAEAPSMLPRGIVRCPWHTGCFAAACELLAFPRTKENRWIDRRP